VPRLVDVDARRKEILDAVWRIIPRSGIAGVTTRAIAREAGVSNGVLSHYFADKDALLTEALRSSYNQTHERIAAATADLTGLDAVHVIMLEALPLDAPRLIEAQIGVSFAALALGNAALTEVLGRESERFWDLLSHHIDEAAAAGQLNKDADADNLTFELMLLVEACSSAAVLYPQRATPQRQVGVLDDILSRARRAPLPPSDGI
jgi:AcrR family transcriptional regulator